MHGDEARAATAVARARLSQASRALRKAARAVAQADDGFDTYGHAHITPGHTSQAVALIDAALEEHGSVDIVLLTNPSDHSPAGAQIEGTP